MPQRAFDPRLKAYYLDTSTLTYAFVAGTGGPTNLTPPGFSIVLPWIRKIAEEGNLCVSFAHAAELSDWAETGLADGLAEFLDSLPIVWAMDPLAEERRETEYIAKLLLGAAPSIPFRPFETRRASMGEMMRTARMQGWQPLKGLGVRLTAEARADLIAMAHAGVSRKDHASGVAYRRRRLLRDLAKAAHKRLMTGRDHEYVRVQRGGVLPAMFVEYFDRDTRSFPTLRTCFAQIDDLVENARLRTPNSRKERDQLDGIVGDRQHAVSGGAHCEVFTCDGPTGNWIGSVRKALGLPPPFVLRRFPGGSEAFALALTAT